MSFEISSPLPIFVDGRGRLLSGGYVYLGSPGANPETSPVAAFWDAALTQPALQPLRTQGGCIVRDGNPASVFLAGDHSLSVRDATGAHIIYLGSSSLFAYIEMLEAAADIPRSPLIGGTAPSSSLDLRSTSGAGTALPATTTDYIRFTRGNNGSQELGRFTPGGSLGVGDWTDGQVPNVHAGDDGTGTRVVTIRAKTAALFIGATDRNNAEGGGPVGRSVASFEGYRLANQADSRESGAMRVVTEGASANQLGARVSVLTRRDGLTEADFVERWWISNDGNCYLGNGNGVGGPNRGNYAYGNVVQTISGSTGRAVLELTTSAPDGDGVILGDIVGIGNLQTTNKSLVLAQMVSAGSTPTDRGGEWRLFVKKDGSTLAERARLTADAFRLDVPIGGLAQAPTLTITANAIAPTKPISFVGAGLIKTITPPPGIAGAGGQITLIPTAAFTTDATSNIAIASTAVIGRAMAMTYDGGTSRWYPSY